MELIKWEIKINNGGYKMGNKNKSGGNLTRTEVTTVRFDPQLKYLAELLARKQRRTLSSFAEWAVEQTTRNASIGTLPDSKVSITAWDARDLIWDTDEVDRFIKLVKFFPDLMDFEEQQLWKLIKEHEFFWKQKKISDSKAKWDTQNIEKNIIKKHLKQQWETLHKIINNELDSSKIPKSPIFVYRDEQEINLSKYVLDDASYYDAEVDE